MLEALDKSYHDHQTMNSSTVHDIRVNRIHWSTSSTGPLAGCSTQHSHGWRQNVAEMLTPLHRIPVPQEMSGRCWLIEHNVFRSLTNTSTVSYSFTGTPYFNACTSLIATSNVICRSTGTPIFYYMTSLTAQINITHLPP